MATENKGIGNTLVYDQPEFSRDKVIILAGSGGQRVLTAGMVLGKITSGGKFVQHDQDAVDGSEAAAGILLADVTAEDGVDAKAVAVVRHAAVRAGGLIWQSDIDAGEITTALAELLALGIIAR